MAETTTFDLSADDLEALVRKIKKARDSYAKMNEMEQYVDWGQRKPLLWHLTREGILDTWNEPELWGTLVEAREHASAEDVVDFLAKIESYDRLPEPGDEAGDAAFDEPYYDDFDDGYYDGGGYDDAAAEFHSQRLVEYWPSTLDELAMLTYAEDPSAFEARWESFPEPVQQGLKLVKYRFGDLDQEQLPDGVLGDLAVEQVENDGLPWSVWVVSAGELEQVQIGNQDLPREEFFEFIELFGPVEQWRQAVLERALAAEYIPSFERTQDAWPVADTDQLVRLLAETSLYNAAAEKAFDILLNQRDDSPEELVSMAHQLIGEHNRNSEAELCATAAVLGWKREGNPVPEGVEALFEMRLAGSPHSRGNYTLLEPVIEALRTIPEERVVDHFVERFEEPHLFSYLYAGVQAWPTNERLLDAALANAPRLAESSSANFSSMNSLAYGLSMVGPSLLPRLAEAYDAADNALLRDGLRRTIIYTLAEMDDAGEPIPPDYDRFLTYVGWHQENLAGHNFGNYVADTLNQVLGALDAARAEAIVLPQLDAAHPQWARALEALRAQPTPKLLDHAFSLIAEEGVPGAEDGFNWFERMLRDLADQATERIAQVLASSDSAELHNSVQRVLGDQAYEKMLAEAGAQSAADKTKADKVARLSRAFFGDHPSADRSTVYFFERLDDEPDAGDLNRIGGRPIGVDADSWPHKGDDPDQPMQHMYTLDMATVPGLRGRVGQGVRAVALFVYNPSYNEAWTPYNSDTAVVLLSEDDVAKGPFEGELPVDGGSARAFSVQQAEVPDAVFAHVEWDEERDPQIDEIRNTVYQANAWGGAQPIWLQSDESPGFDFLMQFDEGFVYMNLGDSGVMYVYPDTAFWQCY